MSIHRCAVYSNTDGFLQPTIPNQANINAVEQLVISKIRELWNVSNASGTYSLYVQKIEEEAAANPL
jgi:hypothetical protein